MAAAFRYNRTVHVLNWNPAVADQPFHPRGGPNGNNITVAYDRVNLHYTGIVPRGAQEGPEPVEEEEGEEPEAISVAKGKQKEAEGGMGNEGDPSFTEEQVLIIAQQITKKHMRLNDRGT